MDSTKLSSHELELLKVALPFAQDMLETEGKLPTHEEYRRKLHCRSINAKRIQHYILASQAVKTANRLQANNQRAEDRAVAQYAMGDKTGTFESHILRENARLSRALATAKKREKAERLNRAATCVV